MKLNKKLRWGFRMGALLRFIRLMEPLERKLMPIEYRLYKISPIRSIFQAVYKPLIPDKKILIEIFGQKMYVSLRARHYIQGIYERGTTEIFKKVTKRGMTVFDIGAHIGYYTLLARSLVGSEGIVYAFEPHPENYERLKENIEINGYTNCYPINKAVSDKMGKTRLYLHSDSGRSSLLQLEGGNKWIEVETITLDEFIKEEGVTPDIIKMDIEGAEFLALKGMKRMIEKCDRLILFVEYEHNKDILTYLREREFNIFFITRSGNLMEVEPNIAEPNILACKGVKI